MEWLTILLLSTLAVAYSKPQYPSTPSGGSTVEIEKQEVVEIQPQSRSSPLQFDDGTKDVSGKSVDLNKTTNETGTQFQSRSLLRESAPVEDSTKEILRKIAEVNEKHGLNKKKKRPSSYFHFPLSYQRSATNNSDDKNSHRQSTDFKFPRDPFTNPILDYIEQRNNDPEPNYRVPMVAPVNTEDKDEVPPGQYIKRKITHQQTILVPVFGPAGYPPSRPPPVAQYYPRDDNPTSSTKVKNDLEKQTVDNIRNIVSGTQPMVPSSAGGQYYQPSAFDGSNYGAPTLERQNSAGSIQPLVPPQMTNPYYQPSGYGPLPSNPYYFQPPAVDNNYYRVYGPYVSEQFVRPGKQQFPQWPLAQYFPIVIKDPVMQMVNAFTSMIEYGPSASTGGAACNKKPAKKPAAVTRSQARNSGDDPSLAESGDQLSTVLDIEDLKISESPREARLKETGFVKPALLETAIKTASGEKSAQSHVLVPQHSPPPRNQEPYADELEDVVFDKADITNNNNNGGAGVLSHDGNKKLFSKDNTGSGIFIHKIKVRKGGVAIAGPGGIATAGSGGTAIVGPNGFAYTQPNSLAIAGSGTKVIAVEPGVNLSELIAQSTANQTNSAIGSVVAGSSNNNNRFPRIGKVVAVGPVIYYNRG